MEARMVGANWPVRRHLVARGRQSLLGIESPKGGRMKFRCLAEPSYIEVDADDADEAQLKAFAIYVRDLSPTKISAWPATDEDVWALEDTA